jgi:histidine ammonia-lyase
VVDARRTATPRSTASTPASATFAETRIDKHDLAALQLNLLRSHAAGVDTPLPVRAVRAAMALRANVLAKGFSGIRVETLEALLAMLNRGVHPRVPSRGSVGASGDLAPLAHLALVLVGEGESCDRMPALSAASARPAADHARSRRKASRSSTARKCPRRCSRWPGGRGATEPRRGYWRGAVDSMR